jgi:hypothetical protein
LQPRCSDPRISRPEASCGVSSNLTHCGHRPCIAAADKKSTMGSGVAVPDFGADPDRGIDALDVRLRPFGKNSAVHAKVWRSGKAASIEVGTFRMEGTRTGAVTAIAFVECRPVRQARDKAGANFGRWRWPLMARHVDPAVGQSDAIRT